MMASPATSRMAAWLVKLQYGSAWWFLDQKERIEWQLNTLSKIADCCRVLWA